MADLADFEDKVLIFSLQKRNGLAKLQKYLNGREKGANHVAPDVLEYFDVLARAFLSVAESNNSKDIRSVALQPELGIAHPSKGKPKAIPIEYTTEYHKHDGFQAAFFRAKLRRKGVSAPDADEQVFEEYGFDERKVRRFTKKYRKAIEKEMTRIAFYEFLLSFAEVDLPP